MTKLSNKMKTVLKRYGLYKKKNPSIKLEVNTTTFNVCKHFIFLQQRVYLFWVLIVTNWLYQSLGTSQWFVINFSQWDTCNQTLQYSLYIVWTLRMKYITQGKFSAKHDFIWLLDFTFGWTLTWMWMLSEKKGGASWRSVPGASPWPPVCRKCVSQVFQHIQKAAIYTPKPHSDITQVSSTSDILRKHIAHWRAHSMQFDARD